MTERITRFADICGTLVPMQFFMETTNDFTRRRGVEAVRGSEEARGIIEEIRREKGLGEGNQTVIDFVADEIKAHNLDKKYMQLDGIVTSAGYAMQGPEALRTPVFDDVEPAFERWRRNEQGIFVYSSGSEQAQRDIFAHTIGDRDITGFIDGYFDKTWGEKNNPRTYDTIRNEIGSRIGGDPGECIFYTDMLAELDAAGEAGWTPVLVVREGNKPLAQQKRMDGSIGGDHNYRTISTLEGEKK